MLYLNISQTKHEAVCQFRDKLVSDDEKKIAIKRARRTPTPFIEYSTGDVIEFISIVEYERYCLGKTYKVVGEDLIFHSGLPIGNNYGERKEDGNS